MSEKTIPTPDTGWLTLLEISGEDRVNFLQGQLTQDIAQLSERRPVALAASCDAKGRVLAVLTLIFAPETVYAAVRHDIAEFWVQHVLKYRLRAKVGIEVCENRTLLASEASRGLFDPRHPDAGAEAMQSNHWRFGELGESLQQAATNQNTLTEIAWRAGRLRAGIADIGPHASGKFTPHMLNLDRLGAISFRKGCYTGQEVVARTEHLGAAKRRAWLLKSADGTALTEGDSVVADERSVGRIAAAAGDLALAVLSNDAAALTLSLEDGRELGREI